MRTTVDLPEAVHRRAAALARDRHQSLSSTIAELTVRGLGTIGAPTEITLDPVSGFPTISLGQTITSEDVADALDDE